MSCDTSHAFTSSLTICEISLLPMDEDGSDDDADDVDCVDILLVTVGPSSFWSVIVDSLTVIYCFVDARC